MTARPASSVLCISGTTLEVPYYPFYTCIEDACCAYKPSGAVRLLLCTTTMPFALLNHAAPKTERKARPQLGHAPFTTYAWVPSELNAMGHENRGKRGTMARRLACIRLDIVVEASDAPAASTSSTFLKAYASNHSLT